MSFDDVDHHSSPDYTMGGPFFVVGVGGGCQKTVQDMHVIF